LKRVAEQKCALRPMPSPVRALHFQKGHTGMHAAAGLRAAGVRGGAAVRAAAPFPPPAGSGQAWKARRRGGSGEDLPDCGLSSAAAGGRCCRAATAAQFSWSLAASAGPPSRAVLADLAHRFPLSGLLHGTHAHL